MPPRVEEAEGVVLDYDAAAVGVRGRGHGAVLELEVPVAEVEARLSLDNLERVNAAEPEPSPRPRSSGPCPQTQGDQSARLWHYGGAHADQAVERWARFTARCSSMNAVSLLSAWAM